MRGHGVGEQDSLVVAEEESVEEVKTAEAVNVAMMNVLHTLNPKERDIIAMRYGLNGAKVRSLEEIGNIFQVSPSPPHHIAALLGDSMLLSFVARCQTLLSRLQWRGFRA